MTISLRPLELDRDLPALHRWVTHPKASFWGLQAATIHEVRREHQALLADPAHQVLIGEVDGLPAFLTELYDPVLSSHSPLRDLAESPLLPGDLGMHVLVAPTDTPRHGFTRAVFAAVMEHCFRQPGSQRVVVEPDVSNVAIARLNREAGFWIDRVVQLSDKTAALSICDRPAFAGSALGQHSSLPRQPAHLNPSVLDRAQRDLVAKAIAEFSHARLLTPTRNGAPDHWRLDAPDGTTHQFRARQLPLEHWEIDPHTLTCTGPERWPEGWPEGEQPIDVQRFVTAHAVALGIPQRLLPIYLEELASTLASASWKLAHPRPSASELAAALAGDLSPAAAHQLIESSMTEGHPIFVANNGRIGFGLDDFEAYAPEAGRVTRLVWLAVHRSRSLLSVGTGLTEEELWSAELDAELRKAWDGQLVGLGLDPSDYRYLPVHPWQWQHRVAITFAPDLARHDLVHLGEAPDLMQPQQSIRTFANRTDPDRAFVKTALSIQNMGFLRGLSPTYMRDTPAINDWVYDVVAGDSELQRCGFRVLRERAAIGYTGDAFHALAEVSPHQKMIAALWRESPIPQLEPTERLITLAALLHRDQTGRGFVSELIAGSGLTPETWLRALLDAYLRPLVHCLLAHDLAFMPHGENLMLVLDGLVPQRTIMKDIGEEVAVMGDQPLPPEVERIRFKVDADYKRLAVFTDMFDGVLRFIAARLDADEVLTAARFWQVAREVILDHATDHPELAGAIAAYDLLGPEFDHSCLNRLQLRNTLQMVDLTAAADSAIFAGTLANPVAAGSVGG